MNKTCSRHSKYRCDEPLCRDEYQGRQRAEEAHEASQRRTDEAINTTTMLIIDIATGIIS